MPQNFRARLVRRLIAAKELNLSVWHALPSLLPFLEQQRPWEEELAGNFSVAFGLAMKELMETLFPANNAVRYNEENQSLSLLVESVALAQSNTNNSNSISIQQNNYLNNMVDSLLLQQYQHLQNLQQNLPNISIHLTLKPIRAQLKNIFAIPLLTRDIVASKPHLKGGYQRLEAVFQETKSYNEVKQKTYELAEEVGLESAKRTVIAEATITCLEYFQVRDLDTGRVVQGMKEEEDGVVKEEEVVHLVRFEMVTDRGEGGKREGGNWKLIDVDDLLEGNVFH
ncbi:hypothetical protein ACHAWT_000779 [Skeletonema menzelii]